MTPRTGLKGPGTVHALLQNRPVLGYLQLKDATELLRTLFPVDPRGVVRMICGTMDAGGAITDIGGLPVVPSSRGCLFDFERSGKLKCMGPQRTETGMMMAST